MSYFRFKIIDGDNREAEPTYCQWREETRPSNAPEIAGQIRAANPNAILTIERSAVKPPNGNSSK